VSPGTAWHVALRVTINTARPVSHCNLDKHTSWLGNNQDGTRLAFTWHPRFCEVPQAPGLTTHTECECFGGCCTTGTLQAIINNVQHITGPPLYTVQRTPHVP
jgi:hypothetical protein